MTLCYVTGNSFKAQAGQACIHPQLVLWHEELKKYFQDYPVLHCSSEENWVYVDNGTFRISQVAVRRHGEISCDYEPQLRGSNDFSIVKGNVVTGIKDGTPLKSDFFQVTLFEACLAWFF